jgi:hypothetical protein
MEMVVSINRRELKCPEQWHRLRYQEMITRGRRSWKEEENEIKTTITARKVKIHFL